MQILGSKKGASQPKKPHIAKDDLNSTSFYKGLYGLCEGEILGLADGGKSIKLDGTPLINANGQPNFKGVTWDFRAGTLDQSHIAGFPAVENEQSIGVELRHDRPYTKAINNKELSAVRVRLNFNALREQKDNGDITGLSIDYAIDVQTDTGAFSEVLRQTIRGKASSGFKKSHRIDLPQTGKKWTIRVRRITPNRDSDLVADTMTVDAITEIIDAKLAYPCTALLGLTYNSKTFNNIAKLSVRLKGKLIQVPTNYNPDTRQYTGLWDGTFKLAYSNNPAWVFYDLCTHKRYGLGERLTGLVDKWRLYQIGQYCDELIDDGKGGKEPRFTVNVYIQQADDAYKVLQNLASVFRGMSFWDGQNIVVDADTPKEAVYTFSRANVVGGEFSYTGTRAKDRHSVVRVAWDNPDNDFKTEYEFVKDETAIISLGIRQLDINAFGCTSKGQAQRAGLWALTSEQLQTRTVTFKTGLQGFIPQVGQVINIADDIFAGRAISGRIVAVNDNQITLDRQAGKVGDTLTIATADGVLSSAITAINDKIVTVNQALNVANDSIWAIVSDDLNLMQFRILSIAQNDDATFDITALQYEPQKFEAVDNGVHITQEPYSVLKATPITAPNSVTLTSSNRTVQGQAVTTLTINWEQVTGAVAYIVKWRKDDGNWQTLPKISGQSVDIDGVYAGKYVAQVQAVDSFDNESLATTSQLTNITGKTGKPPRLAKLVVKGILFGMQIDWAFARGSEDTNFTEIQVSPDGQANIATLGTFAYPTNKYEITGLQGGLTQFYRARIVDKLGNTSDWTAWTKGVTESRADKVLDLLNGQITQSQLHNDLSAPIGKIGSIESNINAIGGKIPRIESTIGKIGGIENTLNTRLPSIQTDIGRLTNNIGTINTQIRVSEQQLNTAKQAIATAQNTLNTAVSNITAERNRINTAIRDITALQTANNAKTQEITNLTNTVGGHTSSIRELGVTTGDLSQKYSQLKTATDTANSQITAIKQTQSGQATSIERLGVKFDSLVVGGRNLLKNSQAERTIGNTTARENFVPAYVLTKPLEPNTNYILSYEYKTTDNAKTAQVGFVSSVGQHKFKGNLFKTTEWRKDVFKFTTGNNANQSGHIRFDNEGTTDGQSASLWVRNVKLELGNVPSDWTPAPEDLQADIDSKATTANLETLRQTLTNADNALSQQITAMDTAYKSADRQLTANLASETTARTSADTALGQRIDTLTADYNGNKASLANQLKTLSDKDTATARQISSLTANVSTAQNTANTANGKADTATTKVDNAQSTANNALSRANTANSAITSEQRARADGDNSLASRITALDTAYKSADSQTTAKLGQIEQSISDKDRAMASRVDTLTANYTALDNRTNWTQLTVVTDLNTLTETGKYFIRASSNPNAPFTQWTYVVVEKARNDRITQTAWADNNASLVYTRIYNGAWQAWEKTATGKELDTKASVASLNEFKQAQATKDTATAKRIANLDTAYKSADSQLSTRITTVQQTATNAQNAVASVQSELTAKFGSLVVGGRNLLKNSQAERMVGNTTARENFVPAYTLTKPLEPNTAYVLSFEYKTTDNAKTAQVGFVSPVGQHKFKTNLTKTTDWQKGVFKFTTGNNANQSGHIRFDNEGTTDGQSASFWVRNVKLELGSIPTDYTSAPEDLQTAIDDKASTASLNEFKQTSANADTALVERITAIDTAYKQADTATNAKLANAQKAISDNNTALSQRITALDTAYKSADNNLTSRLAREETARASGDNANAQALRTLESTVNGIGGRIGTSEGKIANLERTTSDLNGAIATTQSQMNARFDNLKIGGRNLILGSQVSRTTHGTTNLAISQNIDFGTVTHLVLSCDVRFANAQRATTQGARWFRIGAEIRLVWTDGTSGWYGAWRSNVTNGTSFDGRVEHKIATPTGKTLRAIDSVKIQIWDITGENMLVKNPKLELGTIPTDWTPAPEDMAVDLSPYATNASINEFKQTQATKDTATTQKLSQLESGLNGKANANALNTLTTKVNQVDGKITAQVSKVNTLQSTLNGQTASISQHSQTLNGLSAQYTIKVQTGGVVAGIGLASNNGVSDFAVRADKFYIASPQGQKGDTPFTVLTSPQVINGVQVPAGTYIKNAFIANGSITMAKIADSIQSDNYVQGRSGWRLYKNGELEINSSFGDGTRIQLNSRGLTGWYANGQKAFELGIFN